MHVLHTALSVPQTTTTYLQVDLINRKKIHCETKNISEFIKRIYWFYKIQ